MKLTIAFTALLITASIAVGNRGGAAGQDPLLPPAEEPFATEDVPRIAPYFSSWTTPPGSPTPTPYSQASSVQIAPPTPHSHEESVPSGSIEALVCQPAWPCSEALSVAFCESRYDPAAYNSSGAKGLFQLMPVHQWRGGDFFDPAVNVAVSYQLWSEQGWTPWRACR